MSNTSLAGTARGDQPSPPAAGAPPVATIAEALDQLRSQSGSPISGELPAGGGVLQLGPAIPLERNAAYLVEPLCVVFAPGVPSTLITLILGNARVDGAGVVTVTAALSPFAVGDASLTAHLTAVGLQVVGEAVIPTLTFDAGAPAVKASAIAIVVKQAA